LWLHNSVFLCFSVPIIFLSHCAPPTLEWLRSTEVCVRVRVCGVYVCVGLCVCVRAVVCPHAQSKDQSLNSRHVPKHRMNDGLKMRASVRMTRYLESWGAVKPFAHLQNRDGFVADPMVNGKPRCKVSQSRVPVIPRRAVGVVCS